MSLLEDMVEVLARRTRTLAIPAMGVITGIAAMVTLFGAGKFGFGEKDLVVFLVAGAAFAVAVMTQYLSASRFRYDSVEPAVLHRVVREVMELRKQQSLLPPESRKELFAELRSSIDKDTVQALIDEVRAQVLQNDLNKQIAERAKTTLSRIYAEIDALGRRGNINLVLGVVTAIAGIAALSMFVVFQKNVGTPYIFRA